MTLLDQVARRYGSRPSALLGESDQVMALCIDLHAAKWGNYRDAITAREIAARAKRGR